MSFRVSIISLLSAITFNSLTTVSTESICVATPTGLFKNTCTFAFDFAILPSACFLTASMPVVSF